MVKNMVGKSYQQGLEQLKAAVEAGESNTPTNDIDNGSDTELPSDIDDTMGANPEDLDSGSDPESQVLEEEGEEPIEERR